MAKEIILRTLQHGEQRLQDFELVLTDDVTLPGEPHYSGKPDFGGMSLYIVGHAHGICGLAFADCTQNALDAMADEECLNAFRVEGDEIDTERDERGEYDRLGNDGDCYDLTGDYWCDVVVLDRRKDVDFLLMLAEARGGNLDHLGQL